MRAVPLHHAEEHEEHGGKAVALGHALRAGLPVPHDVDRRQLLVLAFVIRLQFRAFKLEVGLFGVCL